MSNINQLIIESLDSIFERGGADDDYYSSNSFYSSTKDPNTYDQVDRRKIGRASQSLALNRGTTSSIQKFSGGFGGIDKFFNKPGIDVPMNGLHAKHIKKMAAKKFNKAMGEKVI